jgi:hypothetical protein
MIYYAKEQANDGLQMKDSSSPRKNVNTITTSNISTACL